MGDAAQLGPHAGKIQVAHSKSSKLYFQSFWREMQVCCKHCLERLSLNNAQRDIGMFFARKPRPQETMAAPGLAFNHPIDRAQFLFFFFD